MYNFDKNIHETHKNPFKNIKYLNMLRFRHKKMTSKNS